MKDDRRKDRKETSEGRRYDDLKEASATAAERIARATEEVCQAFRRMRAPQETERAA